MELIWTILIAVFLANIAGTFVSFLIVMLPLSIVNHIFRKLENEQFIKLCKKSGFDGVIINQK